MKYKDFESKFNVLAENTTSRFQQGGVLVGDFCKIRKDALKNPDISNKPSNFIDVLKQHMQTDLLLKVSSIKSSKPDTQNDLGTSPTDKYYVDIVIEYAPGLWRNPITLPLECIDVVFPDGNNWSPAIPDSLKKKDPSHIKPTKVDFKDDELNRRTQSKDRKLPSSNTKLKITPKEPKDGRSQTKVKESVEETSTKQTLVEGYVDSLKQEKAYES